MRYDVTVTVNVYGETRDEAMAWLHKILTDQELPDDEGPYHGYRDMTAQETE